ncbi:hypothetical protein OSTOST_08662 [Ostertagia ostertagi]
MAGSSILTPERRIELNPFDIDAWNLILRESQARPIDQARNFYEKLVTQFPNAGRYWKAYIEHELRGKNFENVENLFNRCLVKVLNIDLWKCYVFYVRETKGHLSSFREKMAKAYDFALDKVGLDMNSYSIYSDYISFLKTVPAVGQYAENQRISAVRKIYQRGISTPMVNIESLWTDYCAYEKNINPTLAEKLISERNKEYQVSKKIAKQLETVTRGVNRQAVSVPPRGTAPEMKQMLTVDGSFNSPCYGMGASASYDYFSVSSTALCASCSPCSNGQMFDDLWRRWLKRMISHLTKVGLDMNSYSIYSDYISFLKTVPAVGQYAENQRISAVRKIYQRGISTPMVNIESLWTDYCAYEKNINPTLAEKLISERNKEYQVSKKIAKQLETVTRGVNRQAVSVPPRGTAPEMKQVEMWKKYIQWEKSNPMETEEYGQFARRVVYAYEQSLLCLGYYPDMWYEAALFLQQAGKQLEEKGDVKLAQQMTAEAMQLFDRAISGLMKHSQLLYFAYADFEEERMKFDNVKKIYDNLLAIDHIDPTLVEDNNTRVVFERILTSETLPQEKSSDIWDRYLEFESLVGDLASTLKVDERRKEAVTGGKDLMIWITGGVFPPPPAIARTYFPATATVDLSRAIRFSGFVIESLLSITMAAKLTGPVLDKKVKIENGTMVGPMRVDDVRKDMYQLLATTPDPRFVSTHLMEYPASTIASSIGGKRKRGESGSDDESRGVPTDIYKRRMDMKAAQH